MLAWKRISIGATAREIPLTNLSSIELTCYLAEVSRWLFAWTSILRAFFRGLVIAWWSTRARAYVCATDPLREPRTLYRNGGIGRPWTRQRSGESSRGMPRGHYSIRECRFSARKREKRNLRPPFSSFASRVERDRSNETVQKSSLWALNAISIDLFDFFPFFFPCLKIHVL